MSKPLISIVTVTLNPVIEELLSTINSVVNQSFHDWELIIKDGGSKCDLAEIIPKDPRITLIIGKDKGVFDAMNIGIESTRGEYICFINSGDHLYESTTLEKMEKIITENREAIFIYGDVRKLKSKLGYEFYPNRLNKYFLFSSMVCHQTWFVHYTQYFRRRYESDRVLGADYRYLLHMVMGDQVKYLHAPYVVAIYKGDGISENRKHQHDSKIWINEVKETYFTPFERLVFSSLEYLRSLIRKLIYKKFLADTLAKFILSKELQDRRSSK